MNANGKSDDPIVPGKPTNKGTCVPAEPVEERGSTKRNPRDHNTDRTQRRVHVQSAIARIREAAQREKELQFTALWHHVYDIDCLGEAFYALKPKAAVGVDGVTWREYEDGLWGRLADLSARLKRGAYRARPVRRVEIPKLSGGTRLLGVPALEDKIVQKATTEVLNAIYEPDFMGFSYGFRPGRSPHRALDAVSVGVERLKVNWVLDADIRGFFDAIDHEWLIKFLQHRIGDKRVLRHIQKWLKAGVLVDGRVEHPETGTPQGGIISPLLANIYLHYVFDLWAHQWRKRHGKGSVMIVRYADDFIVGFQRKRDAARFQADLVERLRQFGLELHPDKTRLVEWGRFAASRRKERGAGKPETFNFLGLTHYCATDAKGWFRVGRKSESARMRKKLAAIKEQLRRRMHLPTMVVGQWLRKVLTGYYAYYAVPANLQSLIVFRKAVARLWRMTLNRRGQKDRTTWRRMEQLKRRFLPTPRVVHKYPSQRLRV